MAQAAATAARNLSEKLEQGPVDHDIEVRAKWCETDELQRNPETLRQLNEDFSEREVEAGTGVHRLQHGATVTQRTYQKSFLWAYRSPKGTVIISK